MLLLNTALDKTTFHIDLDKTTLTFLKTNLHHVLQKF